MDSRRSVLIVDSSPDAREVLQTALERRGVRTLLASKAEEGLAMARQLRPDLIVLDLEVEGAGLEDGTPADRFALQSRAGRAPLVLLGSLRRPKSWLPGEFVAKPYHYGPLIRKIEALLDNGLSSPPSRS